MHVVGALYGSCRNPPSTLKPVCVSTCEDSCRAANRLAVPEVLQEEPRWGAEGRESGGPYELYPLESSVAAVKPVEEHGTSFLPKREQRRKPEQQ